MTAGLRALRPLSLSLSRSRSLSLLRSLSRSLSLMFAIMLALPLAAGCDGTGGDNELFGSAANTFDLDFNRVRVKKQVIGGTFDAMSVEFIHDVSGATYIPVKVVANAPVTAGEKKDLAGTNGSLIRVMPKGGDFPEIASGNITFSSITPGESCSGEFYINFKAATRGSSQTNLNGRFSAVVEQVGDKI